MFILFDRQILTLTITIKIKDHCEFFLDEALDIADEEIFYVLFHPEFRVLGLKEISEKFKDSIEMLEKIHESCLELFSKLEKYKQ